jgi:hypothetical protein
MNIKGTRSIWNVFPMLVRVLTIVVLLSLAMPGLGIGAIGTEGKARQESQTITARAQGSTDEDVPLVGAEGWARASVEIGGAPEGAVVSSVRAKYRVVDVEPSDLTVELATSGTGESHTLWNRQSTEGTALAQSTDEVTAFQGALVNGTWTLSVQGGGPQGYIDDFSIVVYFETDMPVPQVEGEGMPGMPAFFRLPEDAVPAGPSPDEDDKSCVACEREPSVVPQDIPPGATIITTEDFEGVFPSPGWEVMDWDDFHCDPCGGDSGAWPAESWPGGVDPCAGDDYPNNLVAWMVYGPFDLSDAVDAGTEFVMRHEVEPDYDWVFFGVSEDGIDYTGMFWDGSSPCTLYNIAYADLGAPSVWMIWAFYSDSSITAPGPWVDDVVIWKNVSPPCATVRIDPPEQTVCGPFTVDVVVENVSDLAAFDFELTYDHNCVQVTGVALGPFLGSTGRSVADVGPTFGVRWVSYGAYSWGANTAPDGDGVLATLTLDSGMSSCDTLLHLQNVTLVDVAGNELCVRTEDGIVHVRCGCDADCPEDINLDGVVDIVDIQLVASKFGQPCPTWPFPVR